MINHQQTLNKKALTRLGAFGIFVLCAIVVLIGCTAGRAIQPVPTTSKSAPAKDIQTSTSSVSSISPEISERAKWSRARKCYKRALKEEKAANTDSAAFYYDLSLQYFNAIDLGAIDVSMTHVLAVQRSVQESYDNFLAGLAELPAGTGAHSVLTEIAPPSEIPPGTTAVLVEEPELSPEEMRDTSVVIASHIQPISMLPPVPISHNNSVKQTIKFYQGRGRKVMLAWMERTAEVFPRIRPILREEGIPEEIMYLAMIESGLKYKAYSRSRASGLWQFIASTGRLYGLHIDRLYDERRHVEKETIAACRYLRKLYGDFGDWYLAMAAYNCGEGRVARHIKRYGTSNFWKLSHLPRQTRNYVPSYLAARIICENPEEYGFPPLPKEKPWDCRMVYVDGAYKLEDIAKAANASHDEVIRINPEFLHGATYSPHDSVMVRLPSHAKGDISAGLAAIPKAKLPDVIEHQVRRGETLSHIAQKYSSTVREILSMPQNARVKPRSMKPGQTIYVPISPQHLASNTQPRTTRTSTSAPDSRITYTVQKGQTLGGIARILGVSVHELCSWNSINDRNQIYPGQKLVVRVPSDMIASGEKTPLYHTVRRGDTVWDIANRYGRQTSDILRWNNLSKRSHIYPGQKLRIKPN